jgi:hypothetical protein
MKSDISTADGTGFNANKFYILAQKFSPFSKPNPANWVLIDYTPNLENYAIWSGNTIPVTVLTTRLYLLDNTHFTAGTQYNVESMIGTLPTNTNYTTTTQLGFGEESILLGNINTSIKATVYKSKFTQTLGFSEYNRSKNPTWDDDNVHVTEAGIYDQFNNLVAIGKLNNPVKKNNNKVITIELDMDF